MPQYKLIKDYKSLTLVYIFNSDLLFGNFIISGNPGIWDNKIGISDNKIGISDIKIGRKKVFFSFKTIYTLIFMIKLLALIYIYMLDIPG